MKKIKKINLAWLAGIIEGEGCLSLCHDYRKELRRHYWKPRLEIANTDLTMMLEVIRIMRGIVGSDLRLLTRKKSYTDPKRKDYWVVSSRSQKDVIQFLEAILPYLVSKRMTAKLLLEYCYSRMKNYRRAPKLRFYTNYELNLIRRIINVIKAPKGSRILEKQFNR